VCSVEGISATGTLVETLCYTVIVGYNVNNKYPFSTYGDVFACWLQDIIVCALLVWYLKPKPAVWMTAAIAFMMFNYWVISGNCGMQVLLMLQVRDN
jgi:mannose-P-dolichol utilization defect 1